MIGSSPTNLITNTIVFTLVFRSFIVGSSLLLATLFTRLEHIVLHVSVLFCLTVAIRIYKESKKKLTRLSVVYYDGDCRFCVCTLRILVLIFRFKHVRFLRGDFDPEINAQMNNENSWIVQDSNGSLNLRSAGLRVLLRTSHYRFGSTRMFDFATRMLQTPFDRLYNLIAEHRAFLSKLISCK
jgi:predicted DCC family thiol-disulfide oxidoreductase YuxK